MTDAVNDVIEVSALRERCATLEHDLVSKKLVVPEAVAAVMPGGVNNPSTTPSAWMRAFEQLVRMHAVGSAPGATRRASEKASDDEIEDVLAAALADEPAQVECVDGATHQVYPKSYHALRWLDHLDAQLKVRMTIARAIADTPHPLEEVRAPMLAPLVESLAVRLWLWILTAETPGLPFAEDEADPSPPEWTKEVAPNDLLRFLNAHHEVNGRRLALLSAAFPAESTSGGRLSLAGFLGAVSSEKGLKTRDVMRQWSLGSVFAAAIANAESNKLAREAAERRSRK